MLTQETIDKFYEDLKALKLIHPIATLTERTGFSKGQISQIVNKKLLPSEAFINKFNESFKIVPRGKIESDISPYDPAFLAGQLNMAERLIAQLESDHEEAKADKKLLFDALTETRQTLNELLKPMAVSLEKIPPVLDTILRNSFEHDKVIMKALDQIVGNPPGTHQKESGKHIIKGALEQRKKDN